MKDAVGGTWLFQIALVFIVLFAGYLALSVNYSKAFKVKNEILSIIARNEGLTNDAQTEILVYLNENNHIVSGNCNEQSGKAFGNTNNNNKRGLYCVKKTIVDKSTSNFDKAYYKVTVFFKFDLPYLGDLFTFKVQGETGNITFPQDSRIDFSI